MDCEHEALVVYTVEVVAQYFYPDKDEGEWGDTIDYNEIKSIKSIRCADCDAQVEVTDELRKKMGI